MRTTSVQITRAYHSNSIHADMVTIVFGTRNHKQLHIPFTMSRRQNHWSTDSIRPNITILHVPVPPSSSYLIHVHVGLGPRTSLPHNQREMIVQPTRDHLIVQEMEHNTTMSTMPCILVYRARPFFHVFVQPEAIAPERCLSAAITSGCTQTLERKVLLIDHRYPSCSQPSLHLCCSDGNCNQLQWL